MLRRTVVIAALAVMLLAPGAHALQAGQVFVGGHIGWSAPVTQLFNDHWSTSLTLSGSLRRAFSDNVVLGVEFGFESHDFDFDKLHAAHPAYQFSGGNLEIMPITFESDYAFGEPSSRLRPFVNVGGGAYILFTDLVQTTGPVDRSFDTYNDSTNFGMHGGGGIMVSYPWGELRLDAVYHQVFRGGEDLGYVPFRIAVIWKAR